MSIADTRASATTNYLGILQINITRLAGKDGVNQIRLYDSFDSSQFIDITFSIFPHNALLVLWTSISNLTKSQIELCFHSGVKIQKENHASGKIGDKTMATWMLEHPDMVHMISDGLMSIAITENVRKAKRTFIFKYFSPSLYSSEDEGRELLKTMCKILAVESAKYGIVLSAAYKLTTTPLKPPKATPLINPFTNAPIQPSSRQYNLNTKYGRKMARNQAAYNYDHGSQEYRNSIDNIGCIIWSVVIVICAVIFLIIWNVSGPDAALKWLK